jgi:hypothetical protein
MTTEATQPNVPSEQLRIAWPLGILQTTNFPIYQWDKAIPLAELTLNHLRRSRINPKLSAWEQLHGRYDFNVYPIAPPGISILAHAKPAKRSTWSTHACKAWYIGPAMDHYRCYTAWAIVTRQIRMVNQGTWLRQTPTRFPMQSTFAALRTPNQQTFGNKTTWRDLLKTGSRMRHSRQRHIRAPTGGKSRQRLPRSTPSSRGIHRCWRHSSPVQTRHQVHYLCPHG